jgi:predicted nucleic acid-binding Zn ribbon protein
MYVVFLPFVAVYKQLRKRNGDLIFAKTFCMELSTKNCLHCNKVIRGRSDKKFCDDQCRNTYNNNIKASKTANVRHINSRLLQNRNILEQLFVSNKEQVIVRKEKLERSGFLFTYHTHTYTNNKNSTYYYCYEYGYLPLDNDRYMLIKQE